MFSPALRHRQKVLAAQAGQPIETTRRAPAEPKADTGPGREYAALRAALHEDLRRLSDVQSIEARNTMKAEMARTYINWVKGVLEAGEEGQAAQDEIVTTMMIWAIDCRDFDSAIRIAAHVLKFNLALPERYNRTAGCFIAEDIAEVALKDPEAVTLPELLQVEQLTASEDMPDKARSKLHKALGRAFAERAEHFDPSDENAPAGGKAAYTEQALVHFQRALALYENCGVKKDIERVERQLKALTAKVDGAQD